MPDKPKADPTPEELKRLKRDELDKVAEDAGVPNPEDLANKEEVIERIEHNPALVPKPEPEPDPAEVIAAQPDPEPGPEERAYEVIGTQHPVFGHGHGEKFAAAIPPEQEALLVESGHIKRLNEEN